MAGTFNELVSLYEIKERKAEERLIHCRHAMNTARAALEEARADYQRSKEMVSSQEEELYLQVMAKIAGKSDFESLKERIHLLKLQLQKRFDHVLLCDRRHQESREDFEVAQQHYYSVLRKSSKLGSACDELRRDGRVKALRKEGLEQEEFTPRSSIEG